MPRKRKVLTDLEGLKEKLADYAHSAWSRWMKHILEKGYLQNDGSIVLPVGFVSRWTRQMNRTHHELTADEQKSDLEEADLMIEIMLQYPEVFNDKS